MRDSDQSRLKEGWENSSAVWDSQPRKPRFHLLKCAKVQPLCQPAALMGTSTLSLYASADLVSFFLENTVLKGILGIPIVEPTRDKHTALPLCFSAALLPKLQMINNVNVTLYSICILEAKRKQENDCSQTRFFSLLCFSFVDTED